ncbi:NAD(P)/FAD-dependent oxidoreductase [Mageeibacillus indolicus]|uniref:Pyridine nucleotide-disulfide oxidoreductase n=1 Tax=Mageeibacillus indolicus (strain UPII9-5) TaxID=699246 RepID=D3QYY7_MAGIU|nr:FAD-dependent oxidoreductase [Mageeibacillus indolicus]ADC90726.1 pyridine nucleotide-disulfide oxidoreductase [Mageeibacillus indolicus UPII9-5]KFA56900.1 FAD-dependent oxidoreductase [Mageeibacillus indolicus 0009-5]
MDYDVIIVGAGPGGIFSAYELIKLRPELRVAVFEAGHPLAKRHCPIDGRKIKTCVNCKSCSIMSGFGGAGAFSDGKYNITNKFGGTLYKYIGREQALELMRYVDTINMACGGEGTKLYSTSGSEFKKICLQNKLNLLDASVRHLGTDINYIVLANLYDDLKTKMDWFFDEPVENIIADTDGSYEIHTTKRTVSCAKCIVSVGRSGSKWMEKVCRDLNIKTNSNRVDLGVRVELPAVIFEHLTNALYESKIVYRTEKFEDDVRTFCMNPHGVVVNENTNGIVTVNGHSYEDPAMHTENTNFALLVAKTFSEPFKDSNGYGESIARLSNMLGGGVIVQRFGDLMRGRRSNVKRLEEGLVQPTLAATPGDLSLVLPKRILDGIVEMVYALDKIAPGTANDDTLLYGVEVKFYNMEVVVDNNLESSHPGLYIIGDGSGITHSLSHASASGVYVARHITAAQV